LGQNLDGDYFVGLSFAQYSIALLCHVILKDRYFFPARSLIHPIAAIDQEMNGS
jgi:hypothetical protein